MIRKPPAHVYSDSAILRVCESVDKWQKPTWKEYRLSNVCLQSSSETRRTTTNTEVTLRSIMFFDSVYSTPHINLEALKIQSEKNGFQMRVVHDGADYTVEEVDVLNDEYGRFDHAELGLV